MAKKFIMACPHCGKYVEAEVGFFKSKKLLCSCGYTIDLNHETITTKVCDSCGNTVAFDQKDGENAECPVCKSKIFTKESLFSLADLVCPSCACRTKVNKHATTAVCPLCDTRIDVQEQLKKQTVKNQGMASVIKYEGGNDVFVWKHPIEDFNIGSQLIVHESQEAVFFKDGKALDLFGSGRYTLATSNLPLIDKLCSLSVNADDVFHSEVYYVNLTTQMGIKWGTDSKVRLFDPASGLYIEIGASGSFNLRVCDSRKLVLKLVGTTGLLKQEEINGVDGLGNKTATGKFKALIMNKVKANLARVIRENNINILTIDEYLDVLSEHMRDVINQTLEEYGLTMPEFYITNVILPDDDPNFRRLKQQFADKTLKVREEGIRKAEAEAAQERKYIEAETEARLKIFGAQGDAEALKIKAQAEAEAYRAQAMAEADEMRAKGYNQRDVLQADVQKSFADSLGTMGGNINIGSGSTGGGMATDMVGMMMGMKMAGIAMDQMGKTMDSVNFGAPIANDAPAKTTVDGWNCSCGCKNITSKFCPECGTKKPEAVTGWTCPSCGRTGITSKFCPECGAKRPVEEFGWTCPNCGTKDIKSKFCPECGMEKQV